MNVENDDIDRSEMDCYRVAETSSGAARRDYGSRRRGVARTTCCPGGVAARGYSESRVGYVSETHPTALRDLGHKFPGRPHPGPSSRSKGRH
jgi:hypothetical protein